MNSFDVTADSFKQDVTDASKQQPILVDFWAPWCGPCKSLMPLLEKLAVEYDGRFKLAKVNIDEQKQLAQTYAVRSVPTVKIFKQGKVVDEFTGAIPETEIRKRLDKHIDRESDIQMQQAVKAYLQGDKDKIPEMISIVNSDPKNNSIRIMYVNVLINEKNYDEARAILQGLPPDVRKTQEVLTLLGQLEFLSSAAGTDGDAASLLQQLEQDPANHALRLQLASLYTVQSNFEQALEQFLTIMRADRSFDDDAGRKGMLRIFDMLGGSGELVTRYRRKMASLLN